MKNVECRMQNSEHGRDLVQRTKKFALRTECSVVGMDRRAVRPSVVGPNRRARRSRPTKAGFICIVSVERKHP